MAFIDQPMQNGEELLGVRHVQSDRRLFEQVEGRAGIALPANAIIRRACHPEGKFRHGLDAPRCAAAERRTGRTEL
jgi:hypothetical protein